MVKITKISLAYVIIITLMIVYIVLNMSPIQLKSGIYVKNPQTINTFELMDHHGHPFTVERFNGHWSMVFFGFSSCPMVCPINLAKLHEVNERLPDSKKLDIIFVTVDPENDTVQHLNKYMHGYDNQFIALTGSLSDINALQRQLHVSVSTAPASHGTDMVLINPQGKLQAYFNYAISTQGLLEDINMMRSE